MIFDSGLTVAESPATLRLQREQLVSGLRDAMLYPRLKDGRHEILPVPEGMRQAETDDGVFHYDPTRTTAEEIRDAGQYGRLNLILGLGPYSKSDIASRIAVGELPVAVVELSPLGVEVKAAWGTHLTAPIQCMSLEASKTPGHLVMITSPLHVLAMRLMTAHATTEH